MISFSSNNIFYTIAFPAYPVNLFVDHYVVMKGKGSQMEERVFPNNKGELFFNLGESLKGKLNGSKGNYHLKESVISGVRSTYFSFAPESDFFMAGFRFTLFGFYHLFNIPASHFRDQNFDSKDVWGKEIEWLREQLLEATDNQKLVNTLDNWVFPKVVKSDLQEIKKWKNVERKISQPCMQVGSVLSQIMGYSHKHSIQLFKEKAGVNPKLIQDVNRLGQALQMMASPQLPGLFPHTYADQSHFIREFKRFTGFTPGDYIKNKPKTFLLYQELEDSYHSWETR